MRLPKPGQVVAEKYRVERELGRGGMGVVFEVTHQLTQQRLAIKWLLPALTSDPACVKRFLREAEIAGRFRHPNAVQVHDLYEADDHVFMVMELLEGESLSARLRREERLPAKQACALLIPCMEALAAAHDRHIIHRDLKPANIFLCRPQGTTPERAKILDFGISRIALTTSLDSTTTTGRVLGTPCYMTPEIAGGRPFDHRIDIYAFGVTLYEAIAGRRPFPGETWPEVLVQIVRDTPPAVRDHVPDVPAGLSEIIAKAMARDPAKRFASMRELASELEPYTHDSPIPVPRRRRMSFRRSSRALRLTALGGTTAALLMASGRAGTGPSPDARDSATPMSLIGQSHVLSVAMQSPPMPAPQPVPTQPVVRAAETKSSASDDSPARKPRTAEAARGAFHGDALSISPPPIARPNRRRRPNPELDLSGF